MLQRLIRSTGAVAVLVLFVFAAVIGTAGLSDASVTRGAVILSATSPAPMALTACDQNTCQAIANSGTTVTDWATSTTAPNSVCTYAVYFENGTIIAESATTCLSAGQQGNADWPDPGKFPANARLCTAWTGIAGKPCNTV
jgi:hypothetical protein